VPEFIDPVFTKTSTKRSFSVIQNERFGLVFVKTGSINSGTVVFQPGLQPDWAISAVWVCEAFSAAAEVSYSAEIFYR
jgi:hypothetical protein